MVVLDTSVAIPLRDGDFETESRLEALGTEDVAISVITRVELENGVYRVPEYAAIRRASLDELLSVIAVLAFDDNSAAAYARIVQQTGYSRRKILDRMIAAQALVHRATLVTLNPDDFSDIPGLQIEAW